MKRYWPLIALLATLSSAPAVAGLPSVLDVQVLANPGGTYAISVTMTHKDEGWSHYADAWDALDENGKVLATRVLYHPLVDEQPFTRSLSGVRIPDGVTEVSIQARDSLDGWSSDVVTVPLP